MTREPGWVLVVVDDAVRRMALFRLVEWAGHRATVADTGRAALAMLHAEPFDLVLLDVSIAERDGQEVLRQGTVNPQVGPVPVLMVASEGEVDTVRPWIEMGADAILTEPFVPMVVRARIDASVASNRLPRQEIQRSDEIE